MNKRSAVLVAAGLVVALIAGGLALGSGIVGPSPTTAVASTGSAQQQEPRIRTVTKTIKVHRKAKDESTSGAASVNSGAVSTSSSWSDHDDSDHEDGFELDDEGEHEDD